MTETNSNVVPVPRDRLRALLRIAVELRDPRWKDTDWVKDLADQCGLDMADPEGVKARGLA